MSTWGSMGDKGLDYNVCNAPFQPSHYKSTQSWGHYRLLGFINISMPKQSLADTCPLPEMFIMDLHLGETSDAIETSGGSMPARPPSPTPWCELWRQ
jgi:hypothetical protein